MPSRIFAGRTWCVSSILQSKFGAPRRHTRESGHPEVFDFPGFRVALVIASLPRMTVELFNGFWKHDTSPSRKYWLNDFSPNVLNERKLSHLIWSRRRHTCLTVKEVQSRSEVPGRWRRAAACLLSRALEKRRHRHQAFLRAMRERGFSRYRGY